METFAQRFKHLRERMGWTQEDVAEKLGLSRPTIAGYESEEKNRTPREETLLRIADLFDTTIDFLLGRTNDPKPHSKNENINSAFYNYEKLTEEEKEYLDMQLELFRDMKKKKNK
ncbi:helix-turn-helix domain-containing protein [Bacillus sp. S/N-304-OC-R1]|uniref:helix-turn-helix domain-containing protein n=1 Tax=Bacillus sp. S/N-304-OC-R1 TaxID=2758034 RepID=UPI001C8DE2C2|nr:helix-turn-helix transcriptional regulator [Bacillus sp. S/N-304-OC-R1]MBY0122196.1 helix-turn-helix transcriptional regulator [Bacillus sp. S/N-304-OC-R1]